DPATGALIGSRGGAADAGDLPTADSVDLTAGGPFLFVSNEGTSDVTVIDATELRAIARVPLGEGQRPRGIQMSPDGAHVYVALSDDTPGDESDDDAIGVVDIATGGVMRMYDAGSDPEQFAISPDGRRLYASNEDAGTMSITDVESGAVVNTLVVGIEPEGVAVSPDGRWVYVTAETSNTISV